jgi:hypothetical protein
MSVKKETSEIHDKAVREIARLRFGFPNSDHQDWKTFINPDEEKNKGVKHNDEVVYPDILVVNEKLNQAAEIGEVETDSTITGEGAKQWKVYSSLCNIFYLYVPDGYSQAAKELLESQKIRYSGLRTYGFDQQGQIVITNI